MRLQVITRTLALPFDCDFKGVPGRRCGRPGYFLAIEPRRAGEPPKQERALCRRHTRAVQRFGWIVTRCIADRRKRR